VFTIPRPSVSSITAAEFDIKTERKQRIPKKTLWSRPRDWVANAALLSVLSAPLWFSS